MSSSLSVILPVYNAQGRLADQVTRLLEIVPELTPEFDITIVDDGSTDSTSEIAQAMARYYPQVRAMRHCLRHGHDASVKTGLRGAVGDTVFVQEDHAPVSPSRLRQMWRTQSRQNGSGPGADTGPTSGGIVQRLVRWTTTWGPAHTTPTPLHPSPSTGQPGKKRRTVADARTRP